MPPQPPPAGDLASPTHFAGASNNNHIATALYVLLPMAMTVPRAASHGVPSPPPHASPSCASVRPPHRISAGHHAPLAGTPHHPSRPPPRPMTSLTLPLGPMCPPRAVKLPHAPSTRLTASHCALQLNDAPSTHLAVAPCPLHAPYSYHRAPVPSPRHTPDPFALYAPYAPPPPRALHTPCSCSTHLARAMLVPHTPCSRHKRPPHAL